MVLLTVRALFDTVDRHTGQFFKHHFLSNNGISNYLTHEENKTIILDPKAKWEVHTERLWKFASRKVTTTTLFAIPLAAEEGKNYDAVLIMSNLSNSDWVCYCDIPKHQEKCTTCTSLSHRSRLLPPLNSNSKYVQVMHQDIPLTNDTHIIIIIPPGEKMVSISVDHYNSNLRHLIYHMPNTYDTIISYPISVTDGAAMLKISNGSTFYSLHLAGLSLPTNAYTAVVMPQGCRKHNAEMYEGNVLRLHIPWSHADTYTYSDFGKEASIPVKLQAGRPAEYDWRLDASEPHLEMFLHPYCHYQLRLFVATQDSLGQAVRFYGIQFPGYYVAVLLMTLSGVIIAQSKGQVSIVMVLRFIIRFGPVTNLLTKLGIPRDDATALTEEGINFTILPLLMYLCAWFVAYLQALLAFGLLSMLSYFGRLFVCVQLVDWLYCSTFMCGTVGIMCISSLLICKTLHLLYVIGRKLDSKDTHRRLTLIFPIVLLVNSQILLSFGPFVIWVKNGAYTGNWFQQLSPDPSRLPALVCCVCVCLLLYADDIIPTQVQGAVSGWLIRLLAVVTVLYSMESVYRLPTFTALTSLITAAPTVLGLVSQLMNTDRRKKE
ncbi:unnamed protein product [Candidula unifasciata]|uniref:Uncharacterized protein n=1 Tax=Candidula unifasciata TaxID=100452 RepID=A0A8S3Z3M7_9EUPU|nr:unnamed protein product [Candidula unifasciata]